MSVFLKYLSLTTLVLQTTTLVLLLRFSRTVSQSGPRYLSSTTIVISELLKLFACLGVLLVESGASLMHWTTLLSREVCQKPKETARLLVPAALYTVQNNLLFIALSNLDAATYQVTYQLKILTTALCAVTMLHKRLDVHQWFALFLLTVGVVFVQWPSEAEPSDAKPNLPQPMGSQLTGLVAVVAASFSSGFSGVYFEKLLKSSPQSLWIRNIQLALFSLLFGVTAVLCQDAGAVMELGFFQGYNAVTWIVVLLQAFGGLVVSTVIKYADNILKGFATSISIVLSTLFSYYILHDFAPTNYFIFGATTVIAATLLYGYQIMPTSKPVANS